jgi:hypothetical protein
MKMNNKRLCGFCKLTFRSQRVYNHHVEGCTEIPPKKVDTRARTCYPKNGPRPKASTSSLTTDRNPKVRRNNERAMENNRGVRSVRSVRPRREPWTDLSNS